MMSAIDAIFTILFGVCLPTWDVYSDFISAFRLIIPTCYDYKANYYYEKYHNMADLVIINLFKLINIYRVSKYHMLPGKELFLI